MDPFEQETPDSYDLTERFGEDEDGPDGPEPGSDDLPDSRELDPRLWEVD